MIPQDKFIHKGSVSKDQLIAMVEAMFVLTPKIREDVEYYASMATSPGEPDRTYQWFYSNALNGAELATQPLLTEDWKDGQGTQDGGFSEGPGLAIRWQKGPLAPEVGELPWNGAYMRTALEAVKRRIEFLRKNDPQVGYDTALAAVEEAQGGLGMVAKAAFIRGELDGV